MGDISDFCMKINLDIEDEVTVVRSNLNLHERITVMSLIT
jgi:hypothetical protein